MRARALSGIAGVALLTVAGCSADDAVGQGPDAGADATSSDGTTGVDGAGDAHGDATEHDAADASDASDAGNAVDADATADSTADATDDVTDATDDVTDATDATDAADAQSDADAGAADASDAGAGDADAAIDLCHGVVCTALDQCHVAGTCNPATGQCSNPAASDGTACNDGKSCTLTAACQSGTCTAASSVSCATSTCGTSLSAFTGAQTAGFRINGSAAYDSGTNTVVLTSGAAMAEAGSVFYQDALVADAFTMRFDFRATTTNGRADGIAFVMQTNGPAAVGAAYGGFGAMNLAGYGVELDIFDSGPCDPGNGNHAAVDLLSPCGTNGGIPAAITTSPDLFGLGVGDIGDGAWRTAIIQLAGGQLSVTISDSSANAIAVTNLQGVALPGFVSGTPYYLGLSGGSGSNSLYARQEIRNVQITFSSLHCL